MIEKTTIYLYDLTRLDPMTPDQVATLAAGVRNQYRALKLNALIGNKISGRTEKELNT